MKLNDIINAQRLCAKGKCDGCPLKDKLSENCVAELAEETITKIEELKDLVDDTVNHHYYDTLEELQNDNEQLTKAFTDISTIIKRVGK